MRERPQTSVKVTATLWTVEANETSLAVITRGEVHRSPSALDTASPSWVQVALPTPLNSQVSAMASLAAIALPVLFELMALRVVGVLVRCTPTTVLLSSCTESGGSMELFECAASVLSG